MKSHYHLFQDRASKGHGSISGLTSDTFALKEAFVNMHAKKFLTSNQEHTHTSYLLGRARDEGQIL